MAATLVSDRQALHRVTERLRGATRIALDTEANGFHAYRPRLCLIQLAWEAPGEGGEALIDPLAFRPEQGDLAGLAAVLGDPPGPVVVHGGDYDVRLLKRDAAIAPARLFDTEIAARLVGRRRTGLAALVEEIAGVRLSKAAQRTDWARRPLPPRALDYALDDVRYLPALHDRLQAELDRLGRRSWAEEEFRWLESVAPAEE
ncbi:MAG: ribonuclease D, partial [Acidobacteria bacterium]